MASPEKASTTRTSKLLRGFAGKRGAGVAVGEGDLRGGVSEVGEEVLRDGLDERVDLVEADAVAGVAVGGEGSGTEADDADVARTRVAAEAQSEADAGVGGVVGRGEAGEVGGEDLSAVLDGAVEEHALGVGLGGWWSASRAGCRRSCGLRGWSRERRRCAA